MLYIVATPIGNLKDISLRALEILKEVDLILCEDTRVAKKLLNHYQIKTPVLSYHHHSDLNKTEQIINMLKEQKNLALVSDAGTPGISDPGNKLIARIGEAKPLQSINIVPVPGVSALAAAASISGFNMDRFLFLGFPPTKNKRKKFFEEVVGSRHSVIFYESCHKIIKTLEELLTVDKSLEIIICRELTKKFETIYRGSIEKVLESVKKDTIKGEFVIVVKRP